MSLAEKLVALRKQKGLTQMDLAEKLNVSRQAVSRWEVGAAVPGTDNLKVLGELYGVSVDYLLNDDVSEAHECIHGSGNSSTEKEEKLSHKSKILRTIFLFVLVGLVAFMIFALAPWIKQNERSVPMEDMHTESKEDYSKGTFEFE